MAQAIFDKKNVIVTGGAGFLGSHLCDELVKTSKVICIDNFSSGIARNIEHLLQYPDFIFVKHDISEPLDLENVPELERFKIQFQGIQEIYNLACPTSPKEFDNLRIETIRANTSGLVNVLDMAVKYKAKFLQASSAVVYGPRRVDDPYFDESYIGCLDAFHPRSSYDLGKKYAEGVVETYQKVHSIDTRIARIFRTYGPRMKLRDGRMIPDFITDAIDNKQIEIRGDEAFSTSMCYVSDAVDAMIRLMGYEGEDIGPVNIGSDVDVTLAEVAKKIVEMTSSSSQIVHTDPILFYTQLGLPQVQKAKDMLGWLPVVTLDDGLRRTIDYAQAESVRLS